MALITRFSRLLRADIHAVLDRLEEPDVLLQQAIRDMEEVIREHRARLESKCTDRAQCRRRLEELSSRDEEMGQQLDAAIGARNHDVARTVIRRQLESRSLGAVLSARFDSLGAEIARLESRLNAEQHELDGLRQKAEIFGKREEQSEHEPCVSETRGRVTDDEVEAALLREIERRKQS